MDQEYIQRALESEPTTEQYREIALRISDEQKIRLLHSMIGMVKESAEGIDQLYRHFFYGNELDVVNLLEEMGDISWYSAVGFSALGEMMGKDPDELYLSSLRKNIEKLDNRHKRKFNPDNVNSRDLDAERAILEKDHV